MHLGPDFSRFGHDLLLKRYFLSREKLNAGQNCFQTVTIFFYFFLQHVSLTLFYLCPRRFWKVLLALILGGPSKSCVFKKIYT